MTRALFDWLNGEKGSITVPKRVQARGGEMVSCKGKRKVAQAFYCKIQCSSAVKVT